MGAMFFGGLQVGGLVAMCESHVRECNNSPARISLNHIDNIHNVNISGSILKHGQPK